MLQLGQDHPSSIKENEGDDRAHDPDEELGARENTGSENNGGGWAIVTCASVSTGKAGELEDC